VNGARHSSLPASRPPELQRLRRHAAVEQAPERVPPHQIVTRLTPPGIAATAATETQSMKMTIEDRLTPPGIAATAAAGRTTAGNCNSPPHAPRNCSDCGAADPQALPGCRAASRPPELQRLRLGLKPEEIDGDGPPHAPRNCSDCGCLPGFDGNSLISRLTPPGIAATAATPSRFRHRACWPASRPPELQRLRLGEELLVGSGGHPPHAPRNCSDCGH